VGSTTWPMEETLSGPLEELHRSRSHIGLAREIREGGSLRVSPWVFCVLALCSLPPSLITWRYWFLSFPTPSGFCWRVILSNNLYCWWLYWCRCCRCRRYCLFVLVVVAMMVGVGVGGVYICDCSSTSEKKRYSSM